MGELANCVRCDTVYVKTTRNICADCYQKEEQAFHKVYAFLRVRQNRQATLSEIVDATEVKETLITKFIKERRLHVKNFPNLGYSCENCNTQITSGKLCDNCINKLKDDLSTFEQMEERKLNQELTAEKKVNTYYAIDKHGK
ncbi:TIGR03826 family flagellar region protein [Oceanobacillus sp. 1P07AA]|uniref:TIGR03826 family flagellar region protein n=1 Tax=Oceanobacillus sp. 1P07AA TaxID=3132293 RepID=UPI0039A77FEC